MRSMACNHMCTDVTGVGNSGVGWRSWEQACITRERSIFLSQPGRSHVSDVSDVVGRPCRSTPFAHACLVRTVLGSGELEDEDDYSETTDVSEPSFAMDDDSDGEEPDQKAHLL